MMPAPTRTESFGTAGDMSQCKMPCSQKIWHRNILVAQTDHIRVLSGATACSDLIPVLRLRCMVFRAPPP